MRFIVVAAVLIAVGYYALLSMSTSLVMHQTQALHERYEAATAQAEAITAHAYTQ